MSETIHNNIKNVDNLGGCADYGVPRTLRTYGILEYNEELANLVDNEIEIKQNSEMEIETEQICYMLLSLLKIN